MHHLSFWLRLTQAIASRFSAAWLPGVGLNIVLRFCYPSLIYNQCKAISSIFLRPPQPTVINVRQPSVTFHIICENFVYHRRRRSLYVSIASTGRIVVPNTLHDFGCPAGAVLTANEPRSCSLYYVKSRQTSPAKLEISSTLRCQPDPVKPLKTCIWYLQGSYLE